MKRGIEILKKTTIILTDILMLFSLCMCILSYSIRDIVIGAISQEEVGVQASNYLMDAVVEEFPDEDIDILINVQNDLAKSSSLESITSKYIDAFFLNPDSPYPDTTQDLNQLIEESIVIIEDNLNIQLTDTQKTTLSTEIMSQSQKVLNALQTYTISFVNQGNSTTNMLIQLYKVIDSLMFKCVFIFIIALLVYILYKLKKSVKDVMFHIGIVLLIGGVLYALILPTVGQSLWWEISNRFLGRTISADFTFLQYVGLLLVFISLVILVIINTRYNKKLH